MIATVIVTTITFIILLTTLFSYLIYPAYISEPDRNCSASITLQGQHQLGSTDYHLILLSGHRAVRSSTNNWNPEQKDFFSDILDSANMLTENKPYSITRMHPGYSHNASVLVNRIVEHVKEIHHQHPNINFILSGLTLGGALSMLAAQTLKKEGIDVDVINTRSFSSIGAVVLSNIDERNPKKFLGGILHKLLNCLLKICGNWDLHAQRALDSIASMDQTTIIPKEKLCNDVTVKQPIKPKKASRIIVATWGALEPEMGLASLEPPKTSQRHLSFFNGDNLSDTVKGELAFQTYIAKRHCNFINIPVPVTEF